MFDFSEGSTWFVGGLSITVLLVLLIVLFAMLAKTFEQR